MGMPPQEEAQKALGQKTSSCTVSAPIVKGVQEVTTDVDPYKNLYRFVTHEDLELRAQLYDTQVNDPSEPVTPAGFRMHEFNRTTLTSGAHISANQFDCGALGCMIPIMWQVITRYPGGNIDANRLYGPDPIHALNDGWECKLRPERIEKQGNGYVVTALAPEITLSSCINQLMHGQQPTANCIYMATKVSHTEGTLYPMVVYGTVSNKILIKRSASSEFEVAIAPHTPQEVALLKEWEVVYEFGAWWPGRWVVINLTPGVRTTKAYVMPMGIAPGYHDGTRHKTVEGLVFARNIKDLFCFSNPQDYGPFCLPYAVFIDPNISPEDKVQYIQRNMVDIPMGGNRWEAELVSIDHKIVNGFIVKRGGLISTVVTSKPLPTDTYPPEVTGAILTQVQAYNAMDPVEAGIILPTNRLVWSGSKQKFVQIRLGHGGLFRWFSSFLGEPEKLSDGSHFVPLASNQQYDLVFTDPFAQYGDLTGNIHNGGLRIFLNLNLVSNLPLFN